MAQQIPTLEAAPGQLAAAPRAGIGKVLLILTVLLLVAAGTGAGVYYTLAGKIAAEKDATEAASAQPKGPALYVALDPPFVVNFEAEQLVRFLQVTVQVMSRDPATVDLIKANDPVVRNDLLLLLGNQHYDTLSSREGKENLREAALEAVRKVVANAGGRSDLVEAVYFTSFVMQ
jgi:flagellar FliL protein